MRLSLPKCFLRLPKCALSLSKGCNLRPFDRLRAHQVQGASGSGAHQAQECSARNRLSFPVEV